MARKAYLFWIILAALFFIPFLGNVHLFDWDEINFAEIAREMCLSDNYIAPQINFQPFTEKPPLFFWLQAIAMRFFGINEFSARLPNAILSLIVLPLLYSIGKKYRNHQFGMLWALAYFGAVLSHLYFKSGIIDPWFNFFIFISIYCIAYVNRENNSSFRITLLYSVAGVLLGLAILTKGPVALLLITITFGIYWIWNKGKRFIGFKNLFIYTFCTFLTVGTWFAINYLNYGSDFIKLFTIRQWELLTTKDAGHGGNFSYHFIVLLFGFFPASVFAIPALFNKNSDDNPLFNFERLMAILFWVTLLLFSIVQTKIVHYSSLCYYPLSFFAALSLENYVTQKWKIKLWLKIALVFVALPLLILPIAATLIAQHLSLITPYLKTNVFALENLKAEVQWTSWEFLPSIILLLALILFLRFTFKQKIKHAAYTLFIGTAIYLQCVLICFIGKIETYSQAANIEFWQSHAEEDCYLSTFHYKSYTSYFYGKVKPQRHSNYINADWLFHGNIDKPLYLSCKVNKVAELIREVPDATFLYHKNGFYFYKRSPKNKRDDN